MNDFADLAFECILLPSILDTKVLVQPADDPENGRRASQVLKELLTQLINVTKALNSAAANNNEDGEEQEVDEGSLKKKAYIQLMIVKIMAYLSWDLSLLNDVAALQLLALETLSTILMPDEKFQSFAQVLYYRWVLNTVPILNYPTPSVNKAQIFNNCRGLERYFCTVDPQTGSTVTNTSCEALKFLDNISEKLPFDSRPTKDSFQIGSDPANEFLPFCANKHLDGKIQPIVYQAQIIGDLIRYHFFLEDYLNCRKYLAKMKTFDAAVISQVISKAQLDAYDKATIKNGNKKKSLPDDQATPFYQQIKDELLLKHKDQQRPYDMALAKNIPLRIERGLPFPQSEECVKKADLRGMDSLVQYLNGTKTVSYGKPPSFNEKMDKTKSKGCSKSVRKRDLLLALMREKRPDKVMKLIQDLQKISVNVKKAVLRWHLDDLTIVQAAGRTIDSDYIFVLLAKVQQLTQMKAFEESKVLLTAAERVINDKPWSNEKAKALHFLQLQKASLAMSEYQNSKGVGLEESDLDSLKAEVKECFDNLIKLDSSVASASATQSQVFEMTVATLLNLDQFDFIVQRSDKCYLNMVRLASLISSLVCKFHKNYYNTGEFKENCKALAEVLLPVLQQQGLKRSAGGGSNKSGADNATGGGDKQWIKRLIRRLHSPQILSMLCAFFVTYYNSINEDATLEIQCELPPLPLTVNSSFSIHEDNLLNFIQMLAKNCRNPSLSWSLRIQGEVHFAQGNYLAALQGFVQTLIVSTQFFSKPWTNSLGSIEASNAGGWDERIFVKMIKCTSELGHHGESIVLCQFQSEVDYVTAFKSLEERNGFDAMDGLYPFLWEVTILEYAVSMHNKKGELSRKKKALETIAQLEINMNNNEEILREAQASRRSAFLRYLAANYI